jgi:curli biogenesis system outer membrane secretion channel CsgG
MKKRLAVDEFDYSTVKTAIQSIFNTQVDIGKGIRSMLQVRLEQAGKVTVLERAKLAQITQEQDLGASNRVKQGTNARIGRIKGADALVLGDIVIFGRDDKQKSAGGGLASTLGRRFGGGVGAAASNFSKEEKAVVAINYRLVDTETSEVIASGEARGESSRKSKNWGAFFATSPVAAGGGVDMSSKNFQETIIGEAVMDCVNKLADDLNSKAATLPQKKIELDAQIANITGSTVMLNVGSTSGVQVGDRFQLGPGVEVRDPATKELLDLQITPVGELVISTVRDKIATGTYKGPPLKVGDWARKIN